MHLHHTYLDPRSLPCCSHCISCEISPAHCLLREQCLGFFVSDGIQDDADEADDEGLHQVHGPTPYWQLTLARQRMSEASSYAPGNPAVAAQAMMSVV